MLAERVGFEPTVILLPRLISSQVHSTTLPPLLCVEAFDYSQIFRASAWRCRPGGGAQHLGHRHAAVRLLVVFQHRHQRAAHSQAGASEL